MDDLVDLQTLDREQPSTDAIEIPPNGISLDLLQAIYRSTAQPLSVRIRCAVAALPHEVPKLAVNYDASSQQDFATLLDQRIKRLQEMKLIENRPIESKVESKAPLPRVADKRFRRI
jgi:hypothetical protein